MPSLQAGGRRFDPSWLHRESPVNHTVLRFSVGACGSAGSARASPVPKPCVTASK